MHATLRPRLDFCPAICPRTIFSLSVSEWDKVYFAPNLDCCVTRCELLMIRYRWLLYCVDVWPPHQCSDLVWWNSAEILINGLHSLQHSPAFKPEVDWEICWWLPRYQARVRTELIISPVSMSYCHNLVFLVLSKLFLTIKHHGGGWPGCVMSHYIQLWFLQFLFKFKLERF